MLLYVVHATALRLCWRLPMLDMKLTSGLACRQATPSRWANLERVYDAVGHDKMLLTLVGPIMVMLSAECQSQPGYCCRLVSDHSRCSKMGIRCRQ